MAEKTTTKSGGKINGAPEWAYLENDKTKHLDSGPFRVAIEIDPESGESTGRVYATMDCIHDHTDLYNKFLRVNKKTQQRVSSSISIREIEQILA